MNRKASFQISVSFLVILIIALVVFTSSIYLLKKFFTQAEIVKLTYDERTEKEIERLLDDGSRVAIPFDKKTIPNGEFNTFGIGVLNVLNIGMNNDFKIDIKFNKAFDRENKQICSVQTDCGNPDKWLQTTQVQGAISSGVSITKTIRNNEQEKFLLGVNVNGARRGTYIFDLMVCVDADIKITDDPIKCPDTPFPDPYDSMHKLYVEVP